MFSISVFSDSQLLSLQFENETILKINQNFPQTPFYIFFFLLSNLSIFTVNITVLVWLKIKANIYNDYS